MCTSSLFQSNVCTSWLLQSNVHKLTASVDCFRMVLSKSFRVIPEKFVEYCFRNAVVEKSQNTAVKVCWLLFQSAVAEKL